MAFRKKQICAVLLTVLLLLLAGSIHSAKNRSSPPSDPEEEITMIAGFSRENGPFLAGSTVRFSSGEDGTEYRLNKSGEAKITDLPRYGDLLLTVFDQQQQIIGTMPLSFSEGAVIDATTGEDGIGHITLREDTDVVALLFSLAEDGSLQCRLWLTRSHPPTPGSPRKGT